MDLTAFYATVSGLGFTLLGLWGVVADRHTAWFTDRARSRMAYVVSLHFMIPATMALLSLVAPNQSTVWRVVFALMGLSGIAGTVLLAGLVSQSRPTLARGAVLVAMPVYVLVVLVALFPDLSDLVNLTPLQVEAFLVTAILLLGLHAAWYFAHEDAPAATAG